MSNAKACERDGLVTAPTYDGLQWLVCIRDEEDYVPLEPQATETAAQMIAADARDLLRRFRGCVEQEFAEELRVTRAQRDRLEALLAGAQKQAAQEIDGARRLAKEYARVCAERDDLRSQRDALIGEAVQLDGCWAEPGPEEFTSDVTEVPAARALAQAPE